VSSEWYYLGRILDGNGDRLAGIGERLLFYYLVK
jgi:hypothetical protein